MVTKPNLLFISPIAPQSSGNGLAMRAGAILRALSRDFEVSLLVIPVSGNPNDRIDAVIAECCTQVVQLDRRELGSLFTRACHHPTLQSLLGWLHPYPVEWRAINSASIRKGYAVFKSQAFERIHIFRTYMVPFAKPYMRAKGKRLSQVHLDMDDIDSQTRSRMSEITKSKNEKRRLQKEAVFFINDEKQNLTMCDHIYVCSEVDRQVLCRRFPNYHQFHTVPNTVRLPQSTVKNHHESPFCFLFIANLKYPPNQDGLNWFTMKVLPIMKETAPGPFKVMLVGSGDWEDQESLTNRPEYEVKGFVPDLQVVYKACDASIAPLRVGGGTRIKILESLAHKRPVVTTSVGAEGLDLEDGILVGDTAPLFAAACVRMMEDNRLRTKLAEQGFEKVSSCYSKESLVRTLRRVTDSRRPQ